MKKSRLPGALCACLATFVSMPSHAAPVSGQGTWETTLKGRDLDGNLSTVEAYYDTVLGITWLANANYAGTQMTWPNANNWATGLDPYNSGITGWRLPESNPIDGTTSDYSEDSYNGSEDRGFNVSAPDTLYAGSTESELAHLYYNTLGNIAPCTTASILPNCIPQSGYGLANTGPFSNTQSAAYWTGTEVNSIRAWYFILSEGLQNYLPKTESKYAWAVHDGDVGAAVVPLPTSVWLFGSGLLGLVGMARKNTS